MEKRKEKKRSRSLTAISIRLAALLLTLWLMCMAFITLGTTQYVFEQLSNSGVNFAEHVSQAGGLAHLYSDYDPAEARLKLPGVLEYHINQSLARAGVSVRPPSFAGYTGLPEKLSVFADEYAECQTAVLFLDAKGNPLRQSGDFVYFGYVAGNAWQAGSEEITGFCWIDLNDETDERYGFLRVKYSGTGSLYDFRAMRITGYFEDSRIEPLSMAILYDRAYYNAVDLIESGLTEMENTQATGEGESDSSSSVSNSGGSTEPGYTIHELDARNLLEWDVRFDLTAEEEPAQGKELVTIYAMYPRMKLYEPGGPVRYQGTEEHESLLALLGFMNGCAANGRDSFFAGASQFSLWDMIVFSSTMHWNRTDYDPESGQPLPQPEYVMLTAMRASPLLISMRFLRNAYITSFALALIGFLALRRSLKKKLLLPLQEISKGMDGGFTHIPMLVDAPPRWKEPYELWEHYRDAADKLRSNKNERNRLATALDYAKAAEQNRRRMTSGIAHELKTPLAVIHSYAEGLREHIADDKRDKYLDVILAESERMDSMVLEMLDLSRLEAGKVTLSRDEFSLSALSRGIFEKLALAAEAKGLKIEFQCVGPDAIVADEARIAQVIENFAVNAVKYTPPGGKIRVSVTSGRMGATLTVENDSKPFTMEELAKVWDTFYRADEARSGGGTGLGLAIAKSIVELHGGTCAVRNTGTGVAFSFTI